MLSCLTCNCHVSGQLVEVHTGKDFDLVALQDYGFHLGNRRNVTFMVKV